MRGQVTTPPEVADHMLEILLDEESSVSDSRFLFPGVGNGPFVTALYRFCDENSIEVSTGLGIDSDGEKIEQVRERFGDSPVDFVGADFLMKSPEFGTFDYVIGNPPYVPIQKLSEEEKGDYRDRFATAYDRFDLYFLFFERALELLESGGRLAFVTPEKFEYVDSGGPLRRLLAEHSVDRVEHLGDGNFSGYTAYPTVTVVTKDGDLGSTEVVLESGESHEVRLPEDGSSWASVIRGSEEEFEESGLMLEDVTERISVGVATGADDIFVQPRDAVPPSLREACSFSTISGRELSVNEGIEGSDNVFVCPYDRRGDLVEGEELELILEWLETDPRRRDVLEDRSCVEKDGKEWYAWHETPQMQDILQPKIVWSDLSNEPQFWVDEEGDILPRHSVYYLIPEDGVDIYELQSYLNTQPVRDWLFANCQRASNGFIRLQSTVMKKLPIPDEFS